MREIIQTLPQQFVFEPKIENSQFLKKKKKFIVVGMGGSHLASDLLKIWSPSLDLIFHYDYGLPAIKKSELQERLIILNSYSGNTEEVISSFEEVKKHKLNAIAISTGGQLLTLAKKDKVPYIQIPETGIQPRFATGFMMKALLKIINDRKALKEISELKKILNPNDFEKDGEMLAKNLEKFIPIIYSSSKNQALAYNWKIKFNETTKIPSFCNSFPELNHNEITGFESNPLSTQKIFCFLFLKDATDHIKIKKRMEITENLYTKNGFRVLSVDLHNKYNVFFKIFSCLVLADWTTYFLAKKYKIEPLKTPFIEKFKELMQKSPHF